MDQAAKPTVRFQVDTLDPPDHFGLTGPRFTRSSTSSIRIVFTILSLSCQSHGFDIQPDLLKPVVQWMPPALVDSHLVVLEQLLAFEFFATPETSGVRASTCTF